MSSNDEFTLASFLRYLGDGKLVFARCLGCRANYLPPVPLCSKCYSAKFEWIECSKRGVVEAYSVVHEAGGKFAGKTPYIVAIVRLDEGAKIPGVIRNASRDEVSVGAVVRIAITTEPPNYFFELLSKQP